MNREHQEPNPLIMPTPAEDMESISRHDILQEESTLIEDWLERTMGFIYQNADSPGFDQKHETDGNLKSSGLDRNTLLRKGFQPHQIDILYRTMYAHSAGYYYTLNGGYGFQVDAEDSEKMSVVLKLLSSHIQRRGAEPLVREEEQGRTTEQVSAASQQHGHKTSRVLNTANEELLAYGQLKVQGEQLHRKLALSREKRRKLEENVGTLVALNKKRDQELMEREEDLEKMQKDMNDLNDAHTRLLYELQNTRASLAEEKGESARHKSESIARKELMRNLRTINRKPTTEAGVSMRESYIERRPQYEACTSRSPPMRHSTNVRDLEEQVSAAEKRNADYQEENEGLSRRTFKIRMEEMLEQGASSSIYIPSERKTLAAPSAQTAARLLEVAERRLAQATADNDKLKIEVARLKNRDAEHQELEEKYKGMNTLMDLKETENAELRKELDSRNSQHKRLAEQCETLAEKYETLRLLPDAKDADIARLEHEIEVLIAKLAKLTVGDEQIKSLEKQCDENKRLIRSRDLEIDRLVKAQEEAKAMVARLNLQEDQHNSLKKQCEEYQISMSVKEAAIEQLKQACEAQTPREAQFKALRDQLDAAKRLGDYKHAEIGKLNKDLDESMFKCFKLTEKVTKLDAEAQGNEQRIRDLQAEIEVYKNALMESKSKEDTLRFSLEELEAAKEEQADQSRMIRSPPGPNPEEIQAELRQTLRQTQQGYALLQTNYDKLEGELNLLKTRKGEILKLHSMLAASQSEVRKKSEDSSRLLGELNSVRRELERFRAAKENENKEFSRALHRLKDLETEQNKARQELAEAQKEIMMFQRELSNSRLELAATQTELLKMKNQFASKESELLDLRLAASDAKKEDTNKLKELMRKRTAAMKKSIMHVNSIHDALQLTELDITGNVETNELQVLGRPVEITGQLSGNSSPASVSGCTASDQAPELLKHHSESIMKEVAQDSLMTGTEPDSRNEAMGIVEKPKRQGMLTLQAEDFKTEECSEILDEFDKEAEMTVNTVKEAALKATQALRNEFNMKSIRIQELQQEKKLWKEKVVTYSFNLFALVDLMWMVWNKALLAATMSHEVSLRTTKQAEKVWKSLGDDVFCQNELSLEFVEVLKGQEEVTAMAKTEIDAGMVMKLKMDELTDQIAALFTEDLSERLVSNYRQLASYLESQQKRALPADAIYPIGPLPQGLIPTDMHNLLQAQKKITVWQSAVEMEIHRLKTQLHAEQAGRRWKDKYIKDILQKYLSLRAKGVKQKAELEADISEQLGKLADTQYISRPVQTAWTDLWSLFNDTSTKEQPEIPDQFASYWEKLLQKSKWVEALSEKTARQTITTIYAAKIKDDYASMRSNKSPREMPEFLYLYFQDQFGRSARGEEKLMEFMATIITNKNHPEVNKFGLTAGMIRDVDSALSAPILLSQEDRIPTAHLVMQLPTNVNLPRLPLGELQLAHAESLSVEDVWRRDPLVSFPTVLCSRLHSSGCQYAASPDDLDAHQSKEETIPGVTRDNSAPSSVFCTPRVCSPRICNPRISTPRTRGAGVVLAPLPETALGSPRWRAKQARVPVVKDTKLLGMTNEELAHPLADNLVEWKSLFGSPSFSLADLPHPLTEEATEIVFNSSGVQDMLDQLSTQRFLKSVGNVDLGVPITGKQLPQLHALLYQACEAIDVEVPFMYVRDSPYCRAYLWCPKSKRPSVVFNSALFDILSPFELQVVMAQQLAAFKYPKYRLLAMAWTVLILAPTLLEQNPAHGASEIVPEFNIGKIKNTYNLREVEQKKEKVVNHGQWPICSTVVNNLDRWIRFLDLVGDRAAYFVSRNVSTVVSANMKMAAGSHTLARQLNVAALLEQGHQVDAAVHAKELHDAFRLGIGFGKPINLLSRSEPGTANMPEDDPMAGRMERKLGHLGVELRSIDLFKASHSLVVLRARELQRWAYEMGLREGRPFLAT